MNDIQNLFDAISEAGRQSRSGYHLTIGKAVAALEALPADMPVAVDKGGSVGDLGSYRGYYSDLALEPGDDLNTAGALLKALLDANGETFEGYKGGDFTMSDNTPLWRASYGCCGPAIIDLTVQDGVAVLITKDIDE